MTTIEKVLWGAGAVVISLLLGWYMYGHPSQSFGSYGAGITNLTGLSIDGSSPGTLTVNGATTLTGAVYLNSTLGIGSSLSFGTVSSGTTTESIVRQAIAAATTTPCALQNPSATATSSFTFRLNVTTGTSSAGQFVIATGTTAYSTSSVAATFITPASSQFSFITSGTSTTGTSGYVGPSGYVVLGATLGSAVGYGYTFGGTCETTFITL